MKLRKIVLAFFSCFLYESVSGKDCCPENYWPQRSSKMCTDDLTPINITCKNKFFQLNPNLDQGDEFIYNETENALVWVFHATPFPEFCLSLWPVNETSIYPKPVAFVCFPETEVKRDTDFSITIHILSIASTIFLVVTLVIYLSSPQVRGLSGKCMVAFIFSLSAFYALLISLSAEYSSEICIFLAFLMYFWSMSSFFWLNVISFHIWRSTARISFKIADTNKWLIIYCCWGFGIPLFLTIISLILEKIPGEHIKPEIGTTRCWFNRPEATWSYFYGPIAFVVATNIVLFLLTSFKLFYGQTYKLSSLEKFTALKIKFILHLKLFLLMGITWIFEIASFATPQGSWFHNVWFVTDCLNCSQGIIIFLILVVFRKKVYSNILKKCSSNSPYSLTEDEVKDQSETINKFELTTVELN